MTTAESEILWTEANQACLVAEFVRLKRVLGSSAEEPWEETQRPAQPSAIDRLCQLRRRLRDYALKPTGLSQLRIAKFRVEFSADEVIIIPENRVAFFGAPLEISENDHRDPWPLGSAN